MLLNLTNHHSSQWPENQLHAAIDSFGQVVDMDFPHIDPRLDPLQVLSLAEIYLGKIQSVFINAGDGNHVVHLMGELTFVHALARLLQKNSIACCASTSERQTQVLGNGDKVTRFSFVRFRDYPTT